MTKLIGYNVYKVQDQLNYVLDKACKEYPSLEK